MAKAREVATIYTAGLIQGVALVTFPAASAVFTNPADYGLSHTQFGGMFVPQAILSTVFSLLGAGLRKHLGAKRIYMLGLLANLLAMGLLVASSFFMRQHGLAYTILLIATGFLGIGFGLTVPALNTFAAAFFPQKVDRAVLALNALLGLGTALAPIFIAIFVGLGIWWGLPLLVGVLLIVLLAFSAGQTLNAGESSNAANAPDKTDNTKDAKKIPARFWIFAAFALLYGVCETMNGNWLAPYMTSHFGANASTATLALAIFWGMVTVGRVLFAGIEKWFPERMVYRVLPFVLAAAFVASACVPKTSSLFGILTFALAGLGCSALLPLTVSFCQKELTGIADSAAGGLIASYQIGYGIAAFGVGPLQTWGGLNLNSIYGGTTAVALALSVLAFFISSPKSKSS